MPEEKPHNTTRLGALAEKRMIFSMRFVLVFIVFTALVYTSIWSYLDDSKMAWYCFATGCFTFTLLAYPYFGLSLLQTANIVLFIVLQFTYINSAATWQQSQVTVGYFAALVIGILFFLGFRKAVFWATTCSLLIISLPWASNFFTIPNSFAHIATPFNIINCIAVMFINFMMVYLSDSFSKSLVSELLKSKRTLESAQEKLISVQRYRNRFFSSISHEIRTPMNAVRGIAELLSQNKELSKDDALLVETLYRSSSHLLGIINDLLDIGKLEENKLRFIETDFDLREIFYDASSIVKFAASEKNLEFRMEIDPSLPKYVRGDPNRLRQVIVNLLSNAIKFTREGYVALYCQLEKHNTTQADLLQIRVEDTGIGIDASIQPDIFESYVQADTQNQEFGGTGLGLNICRRIVENQGGKIWFISRANKGSTFFVDLPIQRSNKIEGIAAISPKDVLTLEQHCDILLVDDNNINVMVADRQLRLRMPNSQIHTAVNGKVAVDLLEDGLRPNIILMDMHMPVMNGLQATQIIRAHQDNTINSIPIIAMTANISEEDMADCFNVKMNDFISKPFDINELLLKISRLCTIEATTK